MKCPYCGAQLHKIEIEENSNNNTSMRRWYYECFECGYCDDDNNYYYIEEEK